nr:tetratricopeptide repeat protein [Polymorphobacter sp.]
MIYRAILITTAALLATTAQAAGGGGGGGASTPSASAPSYDPAAEYAKGVAAYKAGDFKAADKAFRKVLAVIPRDPATLLLSGLSKAGDGDLKGAAKSYEKALKVDPNAIPARREHAITLAKLGDSAGAAADLTTLKTRAAACADACPQAADLKAAITAVEAAGSPSASLSLPPPALLAGARSGDAAYLGAVSLINQGRYSDAIAALQVARDAFGPHPDVLTYIGYSWRKLGQYDRAEANYRAALAIAPHHRGATEYYGELKAERGDIAGARAMLAQLDAQCSFGCIEAEDLRRWIDARAG